MKTIRILTIIILAFLLPGLNFGETVPQDQAQTVALNFYYAKLNLHAKVGFNDIKISQTFTKTSKNKPVYYVFNIQDHGFVMVAADNSVYPILGYSFESQFSDENHPENFDNWIQGYSKQINYAREQKLNPDSKTANAWKALLTTKDGLEIKGEREVLPLITTTWDQGANYNALCPADGAGPGGHVWSGCVATAMCQIMNYWRYPIQGTGSHGYYPNGYDYQFADFGNTTYNWENMTNSISGNGNYDMALIQYHCGVAVNMMYSPTGSGAYSEDAAAALRTYFHYSSSLQLLEKDSYTEEQWANILRTNLDNRQPMYYDGYGTGGHAFNMDGYQGTDFFHFNWGWSGSYNGYFYLNNLNPGGNNFTNGQGAIVNFVPGNDYPYFCTGSKTLTAIGGTIEDGSGPQSNYQQGADCNWLIYPSDSISKITLSFDRFETNDQDFVSIYDGADASAPLLAQYSGANIPPAVTSTGDKMFITFKAVSNSPMSGWRACYNGSIVDFCKGITHLTDNTGTISDGSGNRNYQNKSICSWIISPPNASSVTLTFTSFDTESENDYVEIYDYSSQQLLATFSGNVIPAPITSNSGKMFIRFITNSTITGTGWTANYSSEVLLNSISGTITYPQANNPVPLANVALSLKNDAGTVIATSLSDANGNYEFTGIAAGNYTIEASANKPWGGVDAVDILLYKKHLAYISPLQGIFLASGDVNTSGNLSVSDLLIIKKRIAATYTSFSSGDWLFNTAPVSVNGSNVVYNFNGLCYGDANASNNPFSDKGSSSDKNVVKE